jgi:hypothetical protein
LRRDGTTLVLVSHDLSTVGRFCERVHWLDRGRIVQSGAAAEVVGTYLAVMQGHGHEAAAAPTGPQARLGDGRMRYRGGALEHEDGTPAIRVRAGTRLVLRLTVEAHQPVADPNFGFVVWMGGQMIVSTTSALAGLPGRSFAPGERADLRVPFTPALANGVYLVSVAIGDASGRTIYDWITTFSTFMVEGSSTLEGTVDLAPSFTYDRAPAGPAAATAGRNRP